MKLRYQPYSLEFKYPFGVSSNVRTHTPTVFVQLEQTGFCGYGEACLPAYLGGSPEKTIAFLEKAKEILKNEDGDDVQAVMQKVNAPSTEDMAAKAAIDMALHDLAGKLEGKPFYEIAGIGKSEARVTSCTIALDQDNLIEKKIREAADFEILKIKAGTANDKALISNIRKYTDKPLYVDVNQGWTDKQMVLEMIAWMKDQNVLLVEQPMPVSMQEDMKWVSERSVLPTIADESAKTLKDVQKLDGAFTGINIKLMKCGGISEALKIIDFAKKNGLKIMLGCMAESSFGTSAMAQLMGLADYIDLDAPNLIVNDPFEGIKYIDGKIYLNDQPGIGASIVSGSVFNVPG